MGGILDEYAPMHSSRMMVRARAVNEDGPTSSSSSFDGFATRDSGDEPRSGASSASRSAASLARERLGTKKKLTAKEAIQLALDDLDSNVAQLRVKRSTWLELGKRLKF